MAATAAQVAKLRRMVDEPSTDTYSDDDLEGYIEDYPLVDERGEEPYTWDTSTTPPSQDDNDDWVPTYDLYAAAADVWEEKAAGLAEDYDFEADGGRYTRSQAYKHYMRMAAHHRARRSPGTVTAAMWPEPSGVDRRQWIANLAEERD